MGKYKILIFDADHTLIDFDADERRAFRASLCLAEPPDLDEAIEEAWAFSARNWRDLGLADIHLPSVQEKYHDIYRDHVREIFDWADDRLGLGEKKEEAREIFSQKLLLPSHYIEGADEVVKRLAESYAVCIATNGLSQMQRSRLAELTPYLKELFISEEMGSVKPSLAFFKDMLRRLGAEKEDCLMIGDSLRSDVAGAVAAHMDCVWLNRRGEAKPAEYSAVREIRHLKELYEFL